MKPLKFTTLVPLFSFLLFITSFIRVSCATPVPSVQADHQFRSSGFGSIIGRWKDSVVEWFTEVPPPGFWERAGDLGNDLQKYTKDLLHNAAQAYPEKIDEFTSTLGNMVDSTSKLRTQIKKHDVSLETFSDELGKLLVVVLEELKRDFPSPDQAPSHEQRSVMVHSTLRKTEDAVLRVGARYGIFEGDLQPHLEELMIHVEHLTVVTGDLIEQHPYIFEALIFGATALIVPERWLLRPFQSLLGFGPYGPEAGSAAAWMQRRFWGRAVKSGSWFSYLQRAGMKPSRWSLWRRITGWFGFNALLIWGRSGAV
ncbi:hypothetical protein BV22DRAFT_1028551 [Leucogyrophana mollusca]|uniref:Uncharacterized protein n=1 Tax=Leucogyrophana mollusca TaxID=85980 RepID=A0ACB8BXE3_9AGAM|nr:hypothetical protein BV22DRAFT_1028551 [Leucogyrophana mollusca]